MKSSTLCVVLWLLVMFELGSYGLTARAQAVNQNANQSTQQDIDQGDVIQVVATGPLAVLDTTLGRINCRLYEKQAPRAVANFIGLAEGTKPWIDPVTHVKYTHKKHYDGSKFTRVVPEFMIQGGDRTNNGTSNPGYTFEDEFDPNLNFDTPGKLAMANSGPNSNASQFFITETDYDTLNHHYTIFGQCDVPSLAVIKAIARVPRDKDDKPLTPVVLVRVTIVRTGEPMPAPPDTNLPGNTLKPTQGAAAPTH